MQLTRRKALGWTREARRQCRSGCARICVENLLPPSVPSAHFGATSPDTGMALAPSGARRGEVQADGDEVRDVAFIPALFSPSPSFAS
jgi:hypothetical protein